MSTGPKRVTNRSNQRTLVRKGVQKRGGHRVGAGRKVGSKGLKVTTDCMDHLESVSAKMKKEYGEDFWERYARIAYETKDERLAAKILGELCAPMSRPKAGPRFPFFPSGDPEDLGQKGLPPLKPDPAKRAIRLPPLMPDTAAKVLPKQ